MSLWQKVPNKESLDLTLNFENNNTMSVKTMSDDRNLPDTGILTPPPPNNLNQIFIKHCYIQVIKFSRVYSTKEVLMWFIIALR